MKRSLLLLYSLVASFVPAARLGFTTANSAAEDILAKLGISVDASPGEVAAAREVLNKLGVGETASSAQIDAAREMLNSSKVRDESVAFNFNDLEIPAGVDKQDVRWREEAGLTTKQAVQAAQAQKRQNELVGGKSPITR